MELPVLPFKVHFTEMYCVAKQHLKKKIYKPIFMNLLMSLQLESINGSVSFPDQFCSCVIYHFHCSCENTRASLLKVYEHTVEIDRLCTRVLEKDKQEITPTRKWGKSGSPSSYLAVGYRFKDLRKDIYPRYGEFLIECLVQRNRQGLCTGHLQLQHTDHDESRIRNVMRYITDVCGTDSIHERDPPITPIQKKRITF